MCAGIAAMWLEGFILGLSVICAKYGGALNWKIDISFFFEVAHLVTYGNGFLNEADTADPVSRKLVFKSYLDRVPLAAPLWCDHVFKDTS